MTSGCLRQSSLVSAVTSWTAFAGYILPPRLEPTSSSGRGGIDLRSPWAILSRLGGTHRDLRGPRPRLGSSNPTSPSWYSSNGRGGIRTHVGINPHDFQSCALSRSATRPSFRLENGGSGIDLRSPSAILGRLAHYPPERFAPSHLGRSAQTHATSAWVRTHLNTVALLAEGVGFEPTRTCVQRLSRASP